MTKDKEAQAEFLTEKVLGECWHVLGWTKSKISELAYRTYSDIHYCKQCGTEVFLNSQHTITNNHDFSSSEGFFALWKAMRAREDWEEFMVFLLRKTNTVEALLYWFIDFIDNPPLFADLVEEYVRGLEVTSANK